MNRTLKHLLIQGLHGSGWLRLRRFATGGDFRLVTYHGVDDRDDPVINGDRLQTDPRSFEGHLIQLARAFTIVDLKVAVAGFLETGQWPRRGLAITFDDGYLNNVTIAAPILRRLGLPATFFVTVDFVEGRSTPWWYRLRSHLAKCEGRMEEARALAIRTEARLRPMREEEREKALAEMGVPQDGPCFYPFMSREQCQELMTMGFEVQGHGKTHASLAAESGERVAEEILASGAFVRSLGGQPWGIAYPYGHAPARSDVVAKAMKAAGFVAGCTTEEGMNDRSADLMRLRRWDLHGGYSPLGALARVS
ncbi:MAG TPA: polysaccharide deacetylase family protein [Kiritimatiellia bacterium]|nr:polysaccharide deacetylase family protein [Kiritimatiellia bacterium]